MWIFLGCVMFAVSTMEFLTASYRAQANAAANPKLRKAEVGLLVVGLAHAIASLATMLGISYTLLGHTGAAVALSVWCLTLTVVVHLQGLTFKKTHMREDQ